MSVRKRSAPPDENSSSNVRAVARALAVLEVLGQTPGGRRLTEVVAHTGLAASTVHRLLSTLQNCRFVLFDRDTQTWHVGPRLFAVGAAFTSRRTIAAAAMPVLKRLRDTTQETANLGMADAGALMVIAQARSRGVVGAVSTVGGCAPLANDAMGKAILATYPAEAVLTVVSEAGLPRYTPTSITQASVLLDELSWIRAKGYALDRGEFISELRCAAAVVGGRGAETVGAISVSGLARRIPDRKLDALGKTVRVAAAEITEMLVASYPEPCV